MSYLVAAAGFPGYYCHDVKATGSILNVMCCQKIACGCGQFAFLGGRDNRFYRVEGFVGPGFDLDKNKSAVGIDHNQIYFAGPAGIVAGELFHPFAFEEFFAESLAPSPEQFRIGLPRRSVSKASR